MHPIVTTLRVRTIWITAQCDGIEHAVADDARSSRPGIFEPLCAVEFFPAPMEAAPVGRCHRCTAVIRARTSLRDVEHRMDAKPSWANRLRCRRKRQ